MTIGDIIRREREARGWTRLELAAASGVSDSAIENIETGRTPLPRIDTCVALARGLGVTLDNLAGEEE